MKRSLVRSLSWSITLVSGVAFGLASCTPPERTFPTGGGGTGGAGGDGGGMVCIPETQEPCYTGPEGTLEVGLCKSGVHICLPSGNGFGECANEVVPLNENCLTAEDEACNGNDPAECAALADGWIKFYGSLGFGQSVHDVAITNTGDIIAVGVFADTIDFGNGPIASTGAGDIFVTKFDPFGNALWSKRYGDASSQAAFAVGIDDMGSIYVGGSLAGSADFDGMFLTSAGGNDAFLVKLDPDGKVVWARNYGDAANQSIQHIEISTTNLIVVSGDFGGTLQFGMGAPILTAQGNGPDVFIARFDGSGFHSASRVFGGPLAETVRGMALDSTDRVYITGGFDDIVTFGGNTLTSTGGRDFYIAALSPTLLPDWAFGAGADLGSTTIQEGFDIVVTPTDQLWVSGSFMDSILLGQKFITNEPLSRGLFLALFDNTGTFIEDHAFGGMAAPGNMSGSIQEARLAFDKTANQLVIAGAFTGMLNFGDQPMQAEGGADPFLAKLSVEPFAFVTSRMLPSDPAAVIDNANNINALALLPSGDLIVGGLQRTPIVSGKATIGEPDSKDGNAMLGRFIH